MSEINMDAEDNTHGEVALAAGVPAGGSVKPAWPGSLRAILTGRVGRSEVPARRYWLRFLDAPLAGEIRSAGALELDELVAAVPRILRCEEGRVDRETVQEWWEFAMRRRWLEQVDSLWGLTERAGKDLQTERERVNSPDPRRLAAGIARWVLPTGLAGAIGLISAKYLSIGLAIVATAVLIIVGFYLLLRLHEPLIRPWIAGLPDAHATGSKDDP